MELSRIGGIGPYMVGDGAGRVCVKKSDSTVTPCPTTMRRPSTLTLLASERASET